MKVVPVSEANTLPWRDCNVLFRGLFFGDRAQLSAIQRASLAELTAQQWDIAREQMGLNQWPNTKMIDRYGLTANEYADCRAAGMLLNVPPDLAMTRRLVGLDS